MLQCRRERYSHSLIRVDFYQPGTNPMLIQGFNYLLSPFALLTPISNTAFHTGYWSITTSGYDVPAALILSCYNDRMDLSTGMEPGLYFVYCVHWLDLVYTMTLPRVVKASVAFGEWDIHTSSTYYPQCRQIIVGIFTAEGAFSSGSVMFWKLNVSLRFVLKYLGKVYI